MKWGGVWQILTSSGGSLNADRGEGGGGKICQNLADVICERSLKGGGFRPITLEKKDFELGVGVEGQDTSRNFEGSFESIRALLQM